MGDTTTLANPEVVDQIKRMVLGEKAPIRTEVPDDIKRFDEE